MTFKCFACGSMDFVSFWAKVFSCSSREAAAEIFPSGGRSSSSRGAKPPMPTQLRELETVRGTSISMVRKLWRLAYDAATDDGDDADLVIADWAEGRGFFDALCNDLCGILRREHLDVVGIPEDVRRWFLGHYRLILPLFDVGSGELVNVQALRVSGDDGPKVLFPRRATGADSVRVSGSVFANKPARRLLLQPAESPGGWVVVTEGGTDSLAVGQALFDLPVIGVPGASCAARAVGEWCRGRKVLLALDSDETGIAAARSMASAVDKAGGFAEAIRYPGEAAGDACDLLDRGFKLGDIRQWMLDAIAALEPRAVEELARV